MFNLALGQKFTWLPPRLVHRLSHFNSNKIDTKSAKLLGVFIFCIRQVLAPRYSCKVHFELGLEDDCDILPEYVFILIRKIEINGEFSPPTGGFFLAPAEI